MAGATGVNEAGTAFITISVNDQTSEALAKVSESLQDFTVSSEKAVATYSQSLEVMADKSRKEWESIAQSSASLGNAMMTPWRMFSGYGKEAVNVMSDFDDQIRSASAKISGASADDIDMLREKAKLLGRTMSFTASEVAGGMVNLAQNGFSASEIDQSIKPVMDLARATGTDVATAAEIASNALRSFGKPATEMGHVCDVLSATANSSSQSLVDLGYAVKYSSANYANAGTSLEEYMKLIGTLANYGTKGSSAGTGLRKIMTQSVSPKTAKLFEQLGIATTDANGNLKEMAALLPEVAKKMEGMGSGERTAWLKELFGASGMTGAQSLMNGADAFESMKSNIDNAEGTAESTAKGMDAGIGGSERMMTSAIEGLQIAFGEAVSGPMKQFYDMINGIATKTSEWVANNQSLVVFLSECTAGAAGLGAALLGLAAAISVTQKAFSVLSGTAAGFVKIAALICANPMAAVIGAAATGGFLLAASLIKAASASKQYSDAAAKMSEEHDKQAESDNQAIARLQKLAAQQSLTDAELMDAQKIVGELSKRYDDLGISVDTASRSIKGLSEAQKKMLEIQTQQRRVDLTREKREAAGNLKQAEKRVEKGTLLEGQEYTMEELQELDKKRLDEYNNSPLKKTFTSGFGLGTYYQDRAVLNPETGKYVVADTSADASRYRGDREGFLEAVQKDKDKLAEEIGNRAKYSLGVKAADAELERLDELTKPAEEKQEQASEQEKQETAEPKTAEPDVKTEYPGDDEYTDTALEQKYGNRGDFGDWTDTDVEEAENGTAPVDVALDPETQSEINRITENTAKANDMGAAYQQQVDAYEQNRVETGPDTGAFDLDSEIADAQSQIDAINSGNQAEVQQYQNLAAETNAASNQVQNGPGSAAMGPMNLNDKSIIETAEYTRQSAEWLKKIYDLIKNQDNSAAFAQ